MFLSFSPLALSNLLDVLIEVPCLGTVGRMKSSAPGLRNNGDIVPIYLDQT